MRNFKETVNFLSLINDCITFVNKKEMKKKKSIGFNKPKKVTNSQFENIQIFLKLYGYKIIPGWDKSMKSGFILEWN